MPSLAGESPVPLRPALREFREFVGPRGGGVKPVKRADPYFCLRNGNGVVVCGTIDGALIPPTRRRGRTSSISCRLETTKSVGGATHLFNPIGGGIWMKSKFRHTTAFPSWVGGLLKSTGPCTDQPERRPVLRFVVPGSRTGVAPDPTLPVVEVEGGVVNYTLCLSSERPRYTVIDSGSAGSGESSGDELPGSSCSRYCIL